MILSFILKMVVSLALQFGLPYALKWAHEKFPFLPARVDAIITKLVEAIVGANEEPMTVKQRKIAHDEAKKQAAEEIKDCVGGVCREAFGAMRK